MVFEDGSIAVIDNRDASTIIGERNRSRVCERRRRDVGLQ
jgi:hypothetical protein